MKKVIIILTVFVFTLVSSQEKSGMLEWIIDPAGARGLLGKSLTEADLINKIGAVQISRDSINIGEGFYEKVTVLYASEEDKKLTIIWKFMPNARSPREIRIRGSASLWKLTNGITLGTTLKQLETMNGKPFTLAGMDWDYQGTVLDWGKGNLGGTLMHCIVRLAAPANDSLTEQELTSISGDKEFSSSNKVMQKLNPVVYEIIIRFDDGPT